MLISAGLILALLVVGIGIAGWMVRTRPAAQRREVVSRPPLVEVQTLTRGDVQEVFVGYGSARADRAALLAAEVSGQVQEVAEGLKDGSAAVKGQALVWIDDRQYRRQLARAEAQLADAEARLRQLAVEQTNAERLVTIAGEEVKVTQEEYQRVTDLYEKQVASKKEWDFARLAYQRSRRELQGLENDVALIEPRQAGLAAAKVGIGFFEEKRIGFRAFGGVWIGRSFFSPFGRSGK